MNIEPHPSAKVASVQDVRPGFARRWRLAGRPRSLRGQMALGSALVALVAVILVACAAVITVAISFDHYQRSLLQTEATQLAAAYGDGNPPFLPSTVSFPNDPGVGPSRAGLRVRTGTTVWVMDQHGTIFVSSLAYARDPAAMAADKAIIEPSLRKALHGDTSQGELSGARFPFLVSRLYYTVPIH